MCSIPRRCCTARQALQEKCKSWGSNAEDHWWGWAQTNDAETSSNMGRCAKKHELHQTKKGASACRKFWKKLTARGWKLIWPWTRVLATELQRKASISCATVCCRFACCAQYILDINAVSYRISSNIFHHLSLRPFVDLSFDASINASQSARGHGLQVKELTTGLVASSSGSGCCGCVVGSRFPISFISTFRDSVRVNIRCIMISEDPI